MQTLYTVTVKITDEFSSVTRQFKFINKREREQFVRNVKYHETWDITAIGVDHIMTAREAVKECWDMKK